MRNFNILEEGLKPIAIAFIIALFIKFFICDFLGNLVILLAIFIAVIYRNPSRDIFYGEDNILAPIDGTIQAIDYVDGKQRIYCNVNLCNVHVLRAPIDDTMEVKSFYHGLNLSANSYKAKNLNERAVIEFKDFNLELLSGVCNNKLLIDENKKEVKQGERIGLFFNGLVIIETKKVVDLSVKIGDKITAGQTVIGK